MAEPARPDRHADRRRIERRANQSLGDLTLPEVRRMLVTTTIFATVLVLFLWMVRTVIIATILGVVVAVYVRPVYRWITRRIGFAPVAAGLTLILLLVPLGGLLAYSYVELADVATYVDAHREEIAAKVDQAIHRLPFMHHIDIGRSVQNGVLVASAYGTRLPQMLRETLGSV